MDWPFSFLKYYSNINSDVEKMEYSSFKSAEVCWLKVELFQYVIAFVYLAASKKAFQLKRASLWGNRLCVCNEMYEHEREYDKIEIIPLQVIEFILAEIIGNEEYL